MRRLLIPALLLLSACQAGGDLSQADQLLASGDADQAEYLYRQAAAKSPEDADLQTRWKAVRAKAAEAHLARIDALLKSGDLTAAERESELAVHYAPEQEACRRRFSEVRALRRNVREQIRQGHEAVLRKDWLRARRILDPVKVFASTFAEVGELWTVVARENHAICMREGARFMGVMDYETSLVFYEDALVLLPGDAAAKEKRDLAEKRVRARVLAHEAEALLKDKKFEEAVPKAREAAALHPESRHVQAVLLEALRLAALDLLARHRSETERGDLRAAFVAIRKAKELELPQKGLREEVEERHAIASKQLAARYLAAGLRKEETGHYGSAWIYYSVAERIAPGFTGLAERIARSGSKLSARAVYRVLVPHAVPGGKAAPGAGDLVAKAVREEISKRFEGKAKGYGSDDLAGDRLRETGLPPDALLRGSVQELWLTTGNPEILKKSVRYESGRVPRLNPEVEAAKARWQQAQASLPELARQAGEAERSRQPYQAALDRAQAEYNAVANRQTTTFDQQIQKQNELNAKSTALDQARTGLLLADLQVNLAKAAVTAGQQDVERKLNAYLAEPPYVDEPVYQDYVFDVATFETKTTARVAFSLKDLPSGTETPSLAADAALSVKDTMIAPHPRAGIPGDPLELPPDAVLLEQGTRAVAAKLVDQLSAAVERHGAGALERAGREGAKGDAAQELHYLSLAWHARAALSEDQAARVKERLRELSGLRIDGRDLEVSRIPVEPLR